MINNILHVYGQTMQHDDVAIVGTRDALEKLKDFIDKTLKSGKRNIYNVPTFYDALGEGYCMYIFVENAIDFENFDDNQLPYADYKTIDWQLNAIRETIRYENDPKKCIEEIKKILRRK